MERQDREQQQRQIIQSKEQQEDLKNLFRIVSRQFKHITENSAKNLEANMEKECNDQLQDVNKLEVLKDSNANILQEMKSQRQYTVTRVEQALGRSKAFLQHIRQQSVKQVKELQQFEQQTVKKVQDLQKKF